MDELEAFRNRHKKNKENNRQHPYINQHGELVIPFDSDPIYHYWNGGKRIGETLKELSAGDEILSKYYN